MLDSRLACFLAFFLLFSCFKNSGQKRQEDHSFSEQSELKTSKPASPFEGTALYVTWNLEGRPALLLGETYDRQMGEEPQALIGKRFQFLMEDGSVAAAKIGSIQTQCRERFDEVTGDESLVCVYLGVQDKVAGHAVFAFQTDLETFDFKWVFRPIWEQVDFIDLSKVLDNIKATGGEGYKAAIGLSIPDVKKFHRRYYILGETSEQREVGDLLRPTRPVGYATQGRRWEFYETEYASVLLRDGDLFHVAINKFTYARPGVVIVGEAKLNGRDIFLSMNGMHPKHAQLKQPSFGTLAEVEYDVFYLDESGEKISIKYAFQPCISASWPCKVLHHE